LQENVLPHFVHSWNRDIICTSLKYGIGSMFTTMNEI
jgi:hypothetical protein